jgi:hypothetical protein
MSSQAHPFILTTSWTVRGSNPGGCKIFRTCPNRPWGPPSFLYTGYRVFPGGKERPERDADPSPLSSAVGDERAELYHYSPSGPYNLYRASVPVQRCTLPYLRLFVWFNAVDTIENALLVPTVSTLIHSLTHLITQ